MRPTWAGVWPASMMRTMRKGRRWTNRDGAVSLRFRRRWQAGRVSMRAGEALHGWDAVWPRGATAGASQRSRLCKGAQVRGSAKKAMFMEVLSLCAAYISMVLRIRPTARPSISNGSPGSTTMVW